MTWQLALANLATIPADTRRVCKVCGSRFDPYQESRNVYCCNECKETGMTAMKRAAAAAKREKKRKPIEQCGQSHQHKEKRKRYWADFFGLKGDHRAST